MYTYISAIYYIQLYDRCMIYSLILHVHLTCHSLFRCIHTHIRTFSHFTYILICIYPYMYISLYVYILICIYPYMYISLYVYILICIYPYMYISLYVYILICIYPYMYSYPMLSCYRVGPLLNTWR